MTFIPESEIAQIAINAAETIIFKVADITARDAISTQKEGDFVEVTTGAGGSVEWYAWDGASWLLVVDQSIVSADGSVTTHSDVTSAGSGAIITVAERNALHDAVTLGGVASDTTDDTLDLVGQELTVNLATGSTDGAMSAGDKAKLDAISGTNSGDEVQATESVLGIAELATQAETNTGTDDLRIVTPLKLEQKTYGVLRFDTALAKPAHSEGYFYYDKDEHAFVGYNDEVEVTQQIGREFYRRVRNESGATITNGKVVYQSGAEVGGEGRALISLADASDPTKSNVIGVVTHDIENNTYGYVTVIGDVNDVDTSSFTAGDTLYLSTTTPGGLQAIKPEAEDHCVQVATAEIINATTGRLNVNLDNFGRLADFQIVSDLASYWSTGLVVTEQSPKDQTVLYTNGQYYYQGALKTISTGGTYNLQNGHIGQNHFAGMTNYQHRYVALYVNGNEQIESVAGPIAAKYVIPELPFLTNGDVCIAIVEIRVDNSGNPKDIDDNEITDCRNGGIVQRDELFRISPDDTQAGFGEDKLVSDGNVVVTKQNIGGNETLRFDAPVASTTVAGLVELATDGESAANLAVQANDSRLSDFRTDDTAIHDNIAGEINAIAEKTIPISGDWLLIEDSQATNSKKKVQLGNLPGGSSSIASMMFDHYQNGGVKALHDGGGTANRWRHVNFLDDLETVPGLTRLKIPITGYPSSTEITVAGDYTALFLNDTSVRIGGSTNNDGLLTIDGDSTFAAGETTIKFDQTLNTTVVDGEIYTGRYTVGAAAVGDVRFGLSYSIEGNNFGIDVGWVLNISNYDTDVPVPGAYVSKHLLSNGEPNSGGFSNVKGVLALNDTLDLMWRVRTGTNKEAFIWVMSATVETL